MTKATKNEDAVDTTDAAIPAASASSGGVGPELNVALFWKRFHKLHSHFVQKNDTIWNQCDCLFIHYGQLLDEDDEEMNDIYRKSTLVHQYLFGFELMDTILCIPKHGTIAYFMGSSKKCQFVQSALLNKENKSSSSSSNIQSIKCIVVPKNNHSLELAQQQIPYDTLWKYVLQAIRKSSSSSTNTTSNTLRFGVFVKERDAYLQKHFNSNNNIPKNKKFIQSILYQWETKLQQEISSSSSSSSFQWMDISTALGYVMMIKDDIELDCLKKSSVLSNKVMKYGFLKKMESLIEMEETITHEQLATHIDTIIENPIQIQIKVPKEDVQSCYFPIIQSGGQYDIRISAQSNTQAFVPDIILVSLGARYQNYCSTISRTFLVDPPTCISDMYELLLELYDVCLVQMKVGNIFKSIHTTAIEFLQQYNQQHNNSTTKKGSTKDYSYLIQHLPKYYGFGIGLDFRDSNFVLNSKNSMKFQSGMTFCLSIGFQNIVLSDKEKQTIPEKSPLKKLSTYSLLISDMVRITKEGPDVMTKMGRNFTDIAYNTNEEEDEDNADDDPVDVPDAPEGDKTLAQKLSKESRRTGGTTNNNGVRTSSRLSAREQSAQADALEGAAERERKQIELMQRRNEDRLRELASNSKRKNGEDGKDQVEELDSYKRTRDYPDSTQPNQVKVDMANQCVFLPICGDPVPFHISTIKNVVMPDADNGTLLRINFYSAGMAIGKDAPTNMVKLVQKYAPYASFIREMTFRSLDAHNLTLAFRQISELRKRARQRELREQEEATLVEQEKLIRTKNERVPRLSDLTMRPVFVGKKTQGNLEAHTNGLRFISTRSEVVDVMYSNIKYAIYQPCENDIMVLIHFHLKNPIMIGKKKHTDVQFFTEVVEASQAVDNARRSMYDPDEMDDEQRERQLRKKLNLAFKEFCKKVDGVAKKNGYELEFDIPYRDLGFQGNPHKEMVQIMPTLNCLVNLTETPFFVVELDQVDHVHFERVTYMSKAFDVVLVNKDFNKMPWRIDMIPSGDKEAIQDWLTDMEITYTEGPMNLNWKQIINTVKEDDRFYMNTEEDEVTEKEAGWEFLRLYGKDDDDEQEEEENDSEFSEGGEVDDEEDDEEEDEEFDSDVDDEEEGDDDDFDADDDLEEQGMDWDEMEAQAAMDDHRKRTRDDRDDDPGGGAGAGNRKSKGGGGGGNNRGGGTSRSSSGGGRPGGGGRPTIGVGAGGNKRRR